MKLAITLARVHTHTHTHTSISSKIKLVKFYTLVLENKSAVVLGNQKLNNTNQNKIVNKIINKKIKDSFKLCA